MTNPPTGRAHPATTWSIALSILMMAAGVLAITLPLMAGIAVGAFVGWLLLFSGALHVAFAWRGHGAAGVLWEVLLGLAYGVIGFYVVAHPLAGLESLTLAVALYLFVEAFLECILWFHIRTSPATGWLLFDGVVTFVLAIMIWSTWPSSAAWVIGTLVGISMLFSGISRLFLSRAPRQGIA